MALKPIRVSQINNYIKRILQSDPLLGGVTVIGEVSNLKFHGTGNVYFSLKDESSKINCFLPAERAEALRYELTEGLEIQVSGYVYVYEKGGTYSLNIRDILVEGTGNLAVAFETLKRKLEQEGLFRQEHKKLIPAFARKVAVVTSDTGAAVRDIIKIIKERSPFTDILLYPCRVQGEGAAEEIAEAIRRVNERFPETDVLITGRGGGSMEELWAFNEEVVARSIFASEIPVISAVGHETDFTIADFAADRRAATPTEAAQMAVPDVNLIKQRLEKGKTDLRENLRQKMQLAELRMERSSPGEMRKALESRLDRAAINIEEQMRNLLFYCRNRLEVLNRKTEAYKTALETQNPAEIMERGYGLILNGEGNVVTGIADLSRGDSLAVLMKDGQADCTVNAVLKR
ncbi:MAG: exodeoxyribonuclease VII large subunit [Firmicutes bacterium]|nr:exodeoxyribonuclease VII large subunit [Bacillota bacterium]